MSDDGADFAEQVLALYKSTLSKADRRPSRKPDVRRVAFGLVALRQALDHFLALHQKDPVRLAAAGAYEADDILTALTSGTAHPIRKYVKSLNSSEERHNRPPPPMVDQGRS